jgi:tetratricopeptide (TPR) repeat protein
MCFKTLYRVLAIAGGLALASQAAEPTAADLIRKGDISDRAFKPAQALQSYLPAERLEPENVELLLRISRQYRHMMSDAGNDAQKLKLGRTALSYDLKAAALAPKNSEAQLSEAITYGKMVPFEGKKEQVAATPRIKAAADRALRLDSQNDNAWHVLGRWNETLADVSGVKRALGGMLYGKLPKGSNEEAVKCFQRAIAINPNRLRHYIELGRTYGNMGDDATARRFIQKGLSMPNREKDDPEMKARGREALANL